MGVPTTIDMATLTVEVNRLSRNAAAMVGTFQAPAIQPGIARHSKVASGTSNMVNITKEARAIIAQLKAEEDRLEPAEDRCCGKGSCQESED